MFRFLWSPNYYWLLTLVSFGVSFTSSFILLLKEGILQNIADVCDSIKLSVLLNKFKFLQLVSFSELNIKLIINHFSKIYKISPRTQNLLSIKIQYFYINSVGFGVFIDQIKNWILEAYHQQLGQDMTFIIWWLSFYFENIGN